MGASEKRREDHSVEKREIYAHFSNFSVKTTYIVT